MKALFASATPHHSPAWRRRESCHNTIVCVWMSRWVWVILKCMSVQERWRGKKRIPLNVLQYMSSTLSSALAFPWNFVLLEGKEKTFQINQSICVCLCVSVLAPQHVASISVFCCVPPLFYPSQRLVTIEGDFLVENKSFLTGFHSEFAPVFSIPPWLLISLQQNNQVFCNGVLYERLL